MKSETPCIKKVLMIGMALLLGGLSFCSYAIDSSLVRPHGTSSTKFMSPDITSSPTSVANERYSNVVACPATISGCPDINGRGAGPNAATTCPDQCIKSRTVTTYANNRYSTQSPSCPTGYSLGGVYAMGDEYKWEQNPAPDTRVTREEYEGPYGPGSGYTCGRGTAEGNLRSDEYCGDNGMPDISVGTYYISSYFERPNIVVVGSSGGTLRERSSCHCYGSCASCDCWAGGNNYKYWYNFLYCWAPAGVYPTGNKVPTSILCTRIKPVWRTN